MSKKNTIIRVPSEKMSLQMVAVVAILLHTAVAVITASKDVHHLPLLLLPQAIFLPSLSLLLWLSHSNATRRLVLVAGTFNVLSIVLLAVQPFLIRSLINNAGTWHAVDVGAFILWLHLVLAIVRGFALYPLKMLYQQQPRDGQVYEMVNVSEERGTKKATV